MKITKYFIPKNKHRSKCKLNLLNQPVVDKTFKISKLSNPHFWTDLSADYNFRFRTQINKLFGVAFGHHHLDSYRIGFTFEKDTQLCLYSYRYEKGVRKKPKLLTKIDYGEKHHLRIEHKNNQWIILLNNIEIDSVHHKPIIKILKYQTYPYIGGKVKSKTNFEITTYNAN